MIFSAFFRNIALLPFFAAAILTFIAVPATIKIAQYFNLKYHRKGTLFGGRYRAVIAKTQYQSDAISRYVGVINPLDVFQPKWREDGLKNPKEAFKFLRSYLFSSFPDKIRKRTSLILASQEALEQYAPFWGDEKAYREFIGEFLKERSDYSTPEVEYE